LNWDLETRQAEGKRVCRAELSWVALPFLGLRVPLDGLFSKAAARLPDWFRIQDQGRSGQPS